MSCWMAIYTTKISLVSLTEKWTLGYFWPAVWDLVVKKSGIINKKPFTSTGYKPGQHKNQMTNSDTSMAKITAKLIFKAKNRGINSVDTKIQT